MEYEDEMISAEEFFGACEGGGFGGKRMLRKRPQADAGVLFAELKIRVAMKAHGVSREKAAQILREVAERKAAEEAEREHDRTRRPW